jgi:hypothetical protein
MSHRFSGTLTDNCRLFASWQMLARKVRYECFEGYFENITDNQCTEDFEAAKAKALKIGAVACYVEDLRREFIEELCFPAVQCNAIYENVYLLGKLHSFQFLSTALTDIEQEPPSPDPSLLALKSKLHKRKAALLSPTAVQEKETTRSASNLHSTHSSPPSRSLPHGVSPNSTSDLRAVTISSITPRRQESPSAVQRVSHGAWTRIWHTAVMRLVSWRTQMLLLHPTCGS